jgi:hypothetical protein
MAAFRHAGLQQIIQLLKPAGSNQVDRPINSFFIYYFVEISLTGILWTAGLK